MILSIRVNNYLVYANHTELSMIADMRIKKFYSNVYSQNDFNALKSVCIYGANNVGKTCMIRAINSIRNVLLGFVAEVPTNLYSGDNVCSLGISFLYEGQAYSYDFKFDLTVVSQAKRGFVYERLAELCIDEYGNMREKEVFVRDMLSNKYYFRNNEDLSNLLSLISPNNILIYTINAERYPVITHYSKVLRGFAEEIAVLTMDNIPIENTIKVFKENQTIREKTVELIKLADLDIDDYLYLSNNMQPSTEHNNERPQEIALHTPIVADDMFKLISVHKGKRLQSLLYDSTGTKKMVALASFIVEALEYGRILVVDELDSSLHFKLTRAIVSLFNSELSNAQLIFTAHDVNLLDCKKLFRKDQIWFAAKNENGAYLYPLTDFTAQKDNIRSDTDLIDRYKVGALGAIPEPDLISVLIKEVEDE